MIKVALALFLVLPPSAQAQAPLDQAARTALACIGGQSVERTNCPSPNATTELPASRRDHAPPSLIAQSVDHALDDPAYDECYRSTGLAVAYCRPTDVGQNRRSIFYGARLPR